MVSKFHINIFYFYIFYKRLYIYQNCLLFIELLKKKSIKKIDLRKQKLLESCKIYFLRAAILRFLQNFDRFFFSPETLILK